MKQERIDIMKWACIGCGFTLAMVENKKVIRIKRNDLYVEVEGGRIAITCRGCGKINELEDNYTKNLKKREVI